MSQAELQTPYGDKFFIKVLPDEASYKSYVADVGLDEIEGESAFTELRKHKTNKEYVVQAVFHLDAMNAEIIAHEAVHIALLIIREEKEKPYPFSINNVAEEERLAYLVGEVSSLISQFYYEEVVA